MIVSSTILDETAYHFEKVLKKKKKYSLLTTISQNMNKIISEMQLNFTNL